jgi:hypothetical protein
MKPRIWLLIAVAVVVVIGLNSFVPIETSRGVLVDTSKGDVSIFRHRRLVAMMTPEGPFPVDNLWLTVYPTNAIPKDRQTEILIPATASVRCGEILIGSIYLDPEGKTAWVRVVPSAQYHWLKLDGEYPLSFTP